MFSQYEVVVDRHQRRRKVPSDWKLATFYGQIEHLIHVELPRTPAACRDLKLKATDDIEMECSVLLAVIRSCDVPKQPGATEKIEGMDIHFYKRMGRLDAVDLNCVSAVVGRVQDGHWWGLIDRSGTLARAGYVDEAEERNRLAMIPQ